MATSKSQITIAKGTLEPLRSIPSCNLYQSILLSKLNASYNTKFGIIICTTCNNAHKPDTFLGHYSKMHGTITVNDNIDNSLKELSTKYPYKDSAIKAVIANNAWKEVLHNSDCNKNGINSNNANIGCIPVGGLPIIAGYVCMVCVDGGKKFLVDSISTI